MNIKVRNAIRLFVSIAAISAASTQLRADTGTCGGVSTSVPFTDVMNSSFFCQIAEAFFSGLSNGTDSSHYSPSANVTREQMAAFITRTMDQSVKRGAKRAALRQFWNPAGPNNLGLTTVGTRPMFLKSDGADVWIANYTNTTAGASSVSRVRAKDGKLLGTWTGGTSVTTVLVAMGKVFATGDTNPGNLYEIDPKQAPGALTLVTGALSRFPTGIAFDGHRIWTSHPGIGSVSIITLNSMGPPTITNVSAGFGSLTGVLFDGTAIWVTDDNAAGGKLDRLNATAGITAQVNVGTSPGGPAFDGTNIWVPNSSSNTLSVVRATGGLAGTLLATLSGNGLNNPEQAAFDGERILVTNFNGDSVSLWKASDLTPIGTFSTGSGTGPHGVCSDGTNFWITLETVNKLARF